MLHLPVTMAAPTLKEYLKGRAYRKNSKEIAIFVRNEAAKAENRDARGAIIATLRAQKRKRDKLNIKDGNLQRKVWRSFYMILPDIVNDKELVKKREQIISRTIDNLMKDEERYSRCFRC